MQNIEMLLSESQVHRKWQTLAIIREISGSNLETAGRYGSKSGVSRIIRKSQQHCTILCSSDRPLFGAQVIYECQSRFQLHSRIGMNSIR